MLLRIVDEIGEMQPQVASLDAGTKDEALVLAAKSGDGQAFEMLHHRHRAKMLRAARRFSRNVADAEDFVLQSLEKAFLHREQLKGTLPFPHG